jgi:hypothetical protein
MKTQRQAERLEQQKIKSLVLKYDPREPEEGEGDLTNLHDAWPLTLIKEPKRVRRCTLARPRARTTVARNALESCNSAMWTGTSSA